MKLCFYIVRYCRLKNNNNNNKKYSLKVETRVLLCPRSQSPELREQDIHSNANAKREFIASSSQGPSFIQRSGVEQGPRALNYSSIYKVKTKTGSWQGRIGCKGSLASANWLDFRARGLSQGGFHPRPDRLGPGYREYTDWSSSGAHGGWSQLLLGNKFSPSVKET